MLTRLSLQNIAIIQDLSLTFESGLNVLTGETGSGKSLILDAIQCVFERKASPKTLLRHGEIRGRIELAFDLSRIHNRRQIEEELAATGVVLETDEIELFLSREITTSSSRSRVNGCPVSLDVMERLGSLLLEIYGQHDLHTLFSISRQRDLLDNLGGEPLLALKRELKQVFRKRALLITEQESLLQKTADRERELDFLRFQLAELDTAAIMSADEDVLLKSERDKLSQQDTLVKAAGQAAYILGDDSDYESQNILKLLSKAQKALSGVAASDPTLQAHYETLQSVESTLQEMHHALDNYGETLDTRPERLDEIVERLDALDKLKRKYGQPQGTLTAVLETREVFMTSLDTLENAETHASGLASEIEALTQSIEYLATSLTDLRTRLGETLTEAIQSELHSLMMPAAQFKVSVASTSLSEQGHDQVQFMFSANPGEGLKPLGQVASGGELSRLMLALKIRTAHADSLTTLILDEIDTGMSGVTVRAVTEKLQTLAPYCQMLVITHQPILAAKATWHWHIQKHLGDSSVTVTATALTDSLQRKHVLSQLASGFTQTDIATTQFIEQLLA